MIDFNNPLFSLSDELLSLTKNKLSNIKPSQWAENHRVMTSEVSSFPGKFRYDRTPYLREIVDHLSPDSDARVLAIMKGAQLGFSTGVIESGIGWIISENPGNIMLLTGHADLAEEAMSGKVDQMIDSCGLRNLIKPNTLRKRNQRTGDTNKSKEFPGGSLISGAAGNHKLLRQRSIRYGFIDDYEAAKGATKESGSTREMIEQRYAAYFQKMKLYFISTPEGKHNSNIEPVYLLGDQRKYHWHCPCCDELIDLRWQFDLDDGEKAGITWKVDNHDKLIPSSVGYICQKCGGFFNESDKFRLNLEGLWLPTSEPDSPNWYSYHLSSLYAAPGMFDWEYYVRNYLEANPVNGNVNVAKMKTFTNLVLGETWEEVAKKTSAKSLLSNTRPYNIGVIPESLSIKDGNGKIMALTLACDLNGVEDDARLDWEVVAWSENGSSYSVDQGSIGTFVPREGSMKHKEDRVRWTYELRAANSVWPEFSKIAKTRYEKDTGGGMYPMISGIDTGHYTKFAYDYIDATKDFFVVGLKGKDVFKYSLLQKDSPTYKPALERGNLYIVEVNKVKDILSDLMTLKWFKSDSPEQPNGFMNFPEPSNGKYGYEKFFKHYESEQRILDHDPSGIDLRVKWIKNGNSQNHFWDVRIYNIALRDILAGLICKEVKINKGTWADYVQVMRGRIN
jgi:phage terminase large subunit GpA-like protein